MDINNNQQINSFLKGMNTDTSDILIPTELYRYAENLRIVTNTDENSGELRLIEGNKLLSTPLKGAELMYLTSIRNYVIAVTRINNTWLILISRDEGATWEPEGIIFGPCEEPIWDNTTLKYALCGVTRWEADNNIKLYLTDNTGKHNMFLLNIDYEHWPAVRDENVPTDIKMISGYVNSSLKSPEISISEAYGSLKPARVQYAYRLYRYGGVATLLSALSNIISLYKSDTEGYLYGDNAARAVDVRMYTMNDLNLKRLQLYRITYELMGQEPTCALIKDTAISETDLYTTITDTGVNISTLSVSEFMALDTVSIKPKIIESKEDYLFAANIKYETDDVDESFKDIDMRSFNYGMCWSKANNSFSVFNGNTIIYPLGGDEDYELTHPLFTEDGDSEYNPEYWTSPNPEWNGIGPHVDWKYCSELTKVAPHLAIDKKQQTRRLKHDETYRFGAILYDKYGRKSSVKWIADIRIPGLTKDQIVIQWLKKDTSGNLLWAMPVSWPDGVEYYIRLYSVLFNIHDLPDTVSAVQIVRCQRGANDTRVISNGLVGRPMLLYDIALFKSEVSDTGQQDAYKFNLIDAALNNETSSDIMMNTKSNKICPSGWMTMQHILMYNDANLSEWNNEHPLKVAIPSENVVMFSSPEYAYASDNVKDILTSYKDSIKLRHDFIYDVFSTCQTNVGYAPPYFLTAHEYGLSLSPSRSNIRIWSWTYDKYGFRVLDKVPNRVNTNGKLIVIEDECVKDNGLNRKEDGSAALQIKNELGAGYITFNHVLPSQIMDGSREQNAIPDYGNSIHKFSFPNVPDWNKFAQDESIRFQDDITIISNESFIEWSYALALRSKCGKKSEFANALEDGGGDADWHHSTYYIPVGTNGKCILFNLPNKVRYGLGDLTTYYHTPAYPNHYGVNDIPTGHAFPLHMASIIKPVTPYKGYNKKAIEDSVYYQYGFYKHINNGSAVIDFTEGDSTAMMFTYNALHNWYDPMYICGTKMGTVYQVPIETDIDLRATNGDTLDLNTQWGYYIQDKASAFDGYSQQRDAYVYNTAYGMDPTILPQTQAVYTDISDNDFDTRIHFSNVKTNGEHVDSWTRFKAADFTDVDTRYGQITDMRLFKEKLVFWLISGMGTLRSNDRKVLQDVDNTQLVLGTGGVLDGYDYLSVVYGMKPDQFADGLSNSHLYWWDGNAKEICQLGQEVVPLSIQKNVSNYIHERNEVKKPNVVYDNKYKEMIFSVVNNESIVYNEFIAQFTSIYKYMPIFDTQVFDNLITTNNTSLFRENVSALKDMAYLFNLPIHPLLLYTVNKDSQYNKVFDISTFGGRFYKGEENLKHIRFTFKTPLKQKSTDSGLHLITNREYDFRLCIPRNRNSFYGDRMRGKTMQCELKSSSNSTDFSLQYIVTKYRISWS